MKRNLKISIIFVVFLVFLSIPSMVKASDPAKEFLNKGKSNMYHDVNDNETVGLDTGELQKINSIIFRTLFTLGVVLSVGIGGVLGIKFMMASAEDKAQIKELLVPYIVGSVVIFGAFAIWKVALDAFEKLG